MYRLHNKFVSITDYTLNSKWEDLKEKLVDLVFIKFCVKIGSQETHFMVKLSQKRMSQTLSEVVLTLISLWG